TRSAKALATSVEKTESAARTLALAGLSPEQVAVVDDVRRSAISHGKAVLSPLEQEKREMSIERWLKTHRADLSAAESLAQSDLSLETLDRLAEKLDGRALDTALCWIANAFSSRSLTAEIQEAASRVYNLVSAVKGFTHMDRAGVAEPLDVGQGLT